MTTDADGVPTRHLTTDEQKVMQSALRASVDVVHEAKITDGVKPTERPWRCEMHSREALLHAEAGEIGMLFASDGLDDPQAFPAEANAAHIVHCVNLHDELVEALRKSRAHVELAAVVDTNPTRVAEAQDALQHIDAVLAKVK